MPSKESIGYLFILLTKVVSLLVLSLTDVYAYGAVFVLRYRSGIGSADARQYCDVYFKFKTSEYETSVF